MPHDPSKPFLRLNDPKPSPRRRGGGGGSQSRVFSRAEQIAAYGPLFRNLRNVLDAENPALALHANPQALAPERLLVLEVTGSIQNFASALNQIDGLEFVGEEELVADEFDQNPEFYMLVPQLAALRELVSLWEGWEETGDVPYGYAPWRELFLHLKAVRPWGPRDRVSEQTRAYLEAVVDGAPDDFLLRLEIELVFRRSKASRTDIEQAITAEIAAVGGAVVHRAEHPAFAYHAVLADIPASEIRRIAALDPLSLAGADPVAAIVPQSVGAPIETGDSDAIAEVPPLPGAEEPIAAVFDAVPLQAHPLLAGRLVLDDPADLEAKAVGDRNHGTAMASIAVHGDLNDPPSPISRRVYFRPVMYAPAFGDELFDDDRLVVDVIVEAVTRMRAGGGSQVFIVNLSLGDRTRPFSGKISTWGRALDYLSYTYGILFLVSAGNAVQPITVAGFANSAAFHAAPPLDRNQAVLRAVDVVKADRRLLAPADSLNAITVGAWHRDAVTVPFAGASPFMPYANQEMPNLSSRLGLGHRRSTKPDVLLAGGCQPARFDPLAPPLSMISHPNPGRFWGLKVAAPDNDVASGTHFTIGTSGANALATHTAHRIFDGLERAYPELIGPMPFAERAALIKAMLVHCASWRGAEQFIRPVVDPHGTMHHEHWRREVCRHLGYGFMDPDDAVACADDRATLWATGNLGPQAAIAFDVPVPATLGAQADHREVRVTLAWMAPVRPGHLAYRAVKLRIAALKGDTLNSVGIATTNGQPTNSQSEGGTIVHRRWCDAKIGDLSEGPTIPLQIQREKDQGLPIDEPVAFGLAVTIEMPGAAEIYTEVRNQILLQPQVPVPA